MIFSKMHFVALHFATYRLKLPETVQAP